MSDTALLLTVYSPERRLIERQTVKEVFLPTLEGLIQILPGHAAIVGQLDTGVLSYTVEASAPSVEAVVSTGFFELKSGVLTVLAETLELKNEIDAKRAKEAQVKAAKILTDSELDEASFKKYQLKLERSIIRQQLADRHN